MGNLTVSIQAKRNNIVFQMSFQVNGITQAQAQIVVDDIKQWITNNGATITNSSFNFDTQVVLT